MLKYLVSPNHLHHLYLGDWSQAYPDAKVYASPRLASKRKDLTFDKMLSTATPEPEWAGQIEQCLFGSGNGWIDELVFFHRASRTVIFTDLVMDFDPLTFSPLSRVTTRWNLPYSHDQPDNAARVQRLGTSRTILRKRYSASRVAKELSELLENPSYMAKAAEIGQIVQAEDGVGVACDAIEKQLQAISISL